MLSPDSIRELGLDLGCLERIKRQKLLALAHPDFGSPVMVFPDDDDIRDGAKLFAFVFGETELTTDVARVLLLEVGKRIVSHPVLLLSDEFVAERKKTAEVLYCAGEYLVQNGIQDVDAEDIVGVPIKIVWNGKNVPIEIVWDLDEMPIGPVGRRALKGMGFTNRTWRREPASVPAGDQPALRSSH
jgi:hypothetical protein